MRRKQRGSDASVGVRVKHGAEDQQGEQEGEQEGFMAAAGVGSGIPDLDLALTLTLRLARHKYDPAAVRRGGAERHDDDPAAVRDSDGEAATRDPDVSTTTLRRRWDPKAGAAEDGARGAQRRCRLRRRRRQVPHRGEAASWGAAEEAVSRGH